MLWIIEKGNIFKGSLELFIDELLIFFKFRNGLLGKVGSVNHIDLRNCRVQFVGECVKGLKILHYKIFTDFLCWVIFSLSFFFCSYIKDMSEL